MLTCTKTYIDIPFAHRAHRHDGHCALIHGHNWKFEITFAAPITDECGFVMDFGKLQSLKEEITRTFDHKLVLNSSDPLAPELAHFLVSKKIGNTTLVPDCSCEGIAKLIYKMADRIAREETLGRAHVQRVTVFEDSKNLATYDAQGE